jgi:hypothetical protein
MVRAGWLASVALVLIGCGAEPPAPEPVELFFPQHDSPLGTGDAALLEGEAVFDDGCLWIQASDGMRFLPLWPADVQLGMIDSQPAVMAPSGGLLVEVGDAFRDVSRLGGSEASAEVARELVGEIPERCATDGFWVVADVLSAP